ncbi:MAG: UDP-N-acetylglucosamine 1-carboxyvinyltransferase, partial [Parcubacteria group bacterium GW2011_GWA2_48_9]
MDRFLIQGGASLEGEVVVSGAKNAALKLLAAALLTKERCSIHNVP